MILSNKSKLSNKSNKDTVSKEQKVTTSPIKTPKNTKSSKYKQFTTLIHTTEDALQTPHNENYCNIHNKNANNGYIGLENLEDHIKLSLGSDGQRLNCEQVESMYNSYNWHISKIMQKAKSRIASRPHLLCYIVSVFA